jgi:hypothetical protein
VRQKSKKLFILACSVTRRLAEKRAQIWPNNAQNGALIIGNFCPKKYLGIIREF